MEQDALLALGSLLRRHREHLGWTQQELAERAGSGFSVDTISNIERGRHRPRRHTLRELMEVLPLSDAERVEVMDAWHESGTGRPQKGAQPRTEALSEHPVGNSLGTWPAGRLVGRVEELRRISGALDMAAQGSGRTVMVAGEAGIGKTRLVQDVAVGAWNRGFLVAVGRCFEAQQTIPFGPVREVLRGQMENFTPAERAEAARHWPHLGLLLSDRLASPDRAAGTSQEEQQRLFREVTGFLEAIARTQPVVLMLDDLHWADSASLDLLLHLVRHTRGGRVLLLGIYRDVALPRRHTLRAVLGDTIREQLVERIRLLPFERDETGALARDIAGERLSDALVDLIHSRTEGNPFFIRQVLEPLKDRAHSESIPLDALSTVNDVPESVRIVILRRVNSLSEGAQEVLGEASALGQTFGFAELQAMGVREEGQVEQALDEVIAAGLLRDIGDDTYAFDHALTQGAIYADLSTRRKRRLNRAAGSALEHLPERKRAGRSAEIAWHFLQGEDPERAFPWSMTAGDAAAALFAHTDAEIHYRTAAELARGLVDERGEAEALDKLADVLCRSGRSGQALEPLQRAAETYERLGDRERYLGLVARLGEAYQFGGRAVEGLDRVLPVVKALEERGLTDPPSASMADLYAALCALYLAVGRFQDALETAETAVSLAESTGNLRALCTTEISRGLALGVANRGAEQRRAFEHASEIAESLTDEWLLALAVFHLGVSYRSVDDVEQAELHMLRALEISDRAALEAWATFVRLSLSDLYVVHGRWQEARHEAERAEAGSRSLGPRPGGSYALITLGRILLLQGEHEAGIGYLDEALAMATRFEYVPGIMRAQETLAWQEVRDGRPRDAVARLDALLAGFPAYRQLGNPSIFAWALLDDGNEGRTAEMLAAARQKALAAASRAGQPEVLLQSARLATRQERWVDAVRDLWEGVAIAQEINLPYDEALLLHEYGRMHAAKGEFDQARVRLAEALTIFRRLGASVDVERGEQTLSALDLVGSTVPATTASRSPGTSETGTGA